jgi:DNA mismatch endonuclease (patch repair protein)
VPKANRDYWVAKVARNRARDEAAREALTAAGWRVETLWECELKDEAALGRRPGRMLPAIPRIRLPPAKAGVQVKPTSRSG